MYTVVFRRSHIEASHKSCGHIAIGKTLRSSIEWCGDEIACQPMRTHTATYRSCEYLAISIIRRGCTIYTMRLLGVYWPVKSPPHKRRPISSVRESVGSIIYVTTCSPFAKSLTNPLSSTTPHLHRFFRKTPDKADISLFSTSHLPRTCSWCPILDAVAFRRVDENAAQLIRTFMAAMYPLRASAALHFCAPKADNTVRSAIFVFCA